jgi:hypothetical protein
MWSPPVSQFPRECHEDGQIELAPRPLGRELSAEEEADVEWRWRDGGGGHRAVSEDDRRGADCFAIAFASGECVLALSPAGDARSWFGPSA